MLQINEIFKALQQAMHGRCAAKEDLYVISQNPEIILNYPVLKEKINENQSCLDYCAGTMDLERLFSVSVFNLSVINQVVSLLIIPYITPVPITIRSTASVQNLLCIIRIKITATQMCLPKSPVEWDFGPTFTYSCGSSTVGFY
ncbi:unnamed protein product [Dibothriocephalus latus]|uniref:Uncharacterized protein n=1 Tax=Dibothriocephalus latus TaxID=60516 RepID=A0A3P7MRU5_DIBLA|nr:unnamed protein product [Dibothriocephalus latus]